MSRGQRLFVILNAFFVTFLLMAVAPGDPAAILLGDAATPERLAGVRAQLGLDQPLPVQYWNWLVAALQGDLGSSLLTNQPVLDTIGQRIGATMSLVVCALIVASVLGILIGMLGAIRGGWVARALEWISVVISAIPPFWLGFLLISWFAIANRWLPATGYVSPYRVQIHAVRNNERRRFQAERPGGIALIGRAEDKAACAIKVGARSQEVER